MGSFAQGTPVVPAIITACAALAGVCVAQLILVNYRRADERQRRRREIADVIAPTLSLIAAGVQQVKLAGAAKVAWQHQSAWRRLVDEVWPGVRTMLYGQAALEANPEEPSFEGVAE